MRIPKEGVVTPDIGTGIHDNLKFEPDFQYLFVSYFPPTQYQSKQV